MLRNNKLYLRLLEKQDLPSRVQWINDEENIQTLLFDYPTSLEKTERWYSDSIMDNSKIHFSIVSNDTDKLIGMTGFLNIDRVNKISQIYITIGAKEYRGQHLPDEVLDIIKIYGFNELGLNKLYLYTLPSNSRGRHVYERNGFKFDGILRSHIFCRGYYQDLYVHSILKDEWLNSER